MKLCRLPNKNQNQPKRAVSGGGGGLMGELDLSGRETKRWKG